MQGKDRESLFNEIGERCVSASCKFASDKGLLRLESDGVGMVKNVLPSSDGPDLLTGAEV